MRGFSLFICCTLFSVAAMAGGTSSGGGVFQFGFQVVCQDSGRVGSGIIGKGFLDNVGTLSGAIGSTSDTVPVQISGTYTDGLLSQVSLKGALQGQPVELAVDIPKGKFGQPSFNTNGQLSYVENGQTVRETYLCGFQMD